MIKTSSDFNALVAYFKLWVKNIDMLHFRYLFLVNAANCKMLKI